MLGRRPFWSDWSVRAQLISALAAINILAVIVAAIVSVLNSRTATLLEIQSSLEVAQRFVQATVADLPPEHREQKLLERLPRDLKHLRHVRILIKDASGQVKAVSPEHDDSGEMGVLGEAPGWFAGLMRPQLARRTVKIVTVDHANPVIIAGDPTDEIQQHWESFRSLAIVWVVLDLATLVLLYVVLGRVLSPLRSLSDGMLDLEDGDYRTRLPVPRVKEIAVISHQFNALAEGLSAAQASNGKLYSRLIAVQEKEKAEIASELHDEAGPCLFGISANAASIKTIAKSIGSAGIDKHAKEILAISQRLKAMNRATIRKLRPICIDRAAIADLIGDRLSDLGARYPHVAIELDMDLARSSYGEAVDLLIYRTVEQGLLHAICERRANRIALNLFEEQADLDGEARLCVVFNDDGMASNDSPAPGGAGASSAFERIKALGGDWQFETTSAREGVLRVRMPSEVRVEAPEARATELV